ncbi:hypothetical protein L5F64_04740 [Aliarcobacter butzleri]|uniref:hypothetical protein n=1 Tax=Aliarcobacter butzleri TaxID=28197 RepID=UPI001EDBC615|nr:hypothetical protein [Aliarcobacter butzleri]MCG3710299.1 hypothetical protein [Aliarcobacter butzleri]MCG3714873.1 hypothetical protein [Aliarcobacter butzleri]
MKKFCLSIVLCSSLFSQDDTVVLDDILVTTDSPVETTAGVIKGYKSLTAIVLQKLQLH